MNQDTLNSHDKAYSLVMCYVSALFFFSYYSFNKFIIAGPTDTKTINQINYGKDAWRQA